MISDINAIWRPLADYALANDCDVARFDNAELVQECLYKQAQLLVSLDKGMEEEVEAQVVGCSSVMGWGLVKFCEGGGEFGNPTVPIQAKDVRTWEHQFAQRQRDETTARAAMSRRRAEVEDKQDYGRRDRRDAGR